MAGMNSARVSSLPSSVSGLDLGLLVFLGAVWGAAFLFFRVVAPELGPLWTAELRVAIAGVALLAVTRGGAWRAVRGRIMPVAVVGATFSAIPFALLAFATLTLPASLASVLMATTPLFTALIGAVWLRQWLAPSVIFGLGVGFGAVALLIGGAPVSAGPATMIAFAAGLAAALSYGFAGTYARRHLAGMRGVDLATGQLVAAAVMLLPVAIASGPLPAPSPATMGMLAMLGIVSTAIPWPVYFRIAARSGPTAASSATFIVPMFGMLWGGLILGEPIKAALISSFGIVLLSLVLVLRLPLPTVWNRPVIRRLTRRHALAGA
jgi:drug/metabolite transporter (DMT)-like permease